MASRRDYFQPDSFLTRLTGKESKQGYKINETDQEIVGQVDAILVASKLEGEPIKRTIKH
jgi:gamma-glutamyltranspeptidase/glutathione hydrolase